MFKMPSTAERHHHTPAGSRRPMSRKANPTGSARTVPANRGRPSGSSSLVVR